MAERRMFHTGVVESDAFLDLPLAAQALYFHICMHADDDGFVNGPKQITRMLGATPDDLTALIETGFLLWFDGSAVVKHWRMANSLKNDRFKTLRYPKAAKQLYIQENRSYTLSPENSEPNLFLMRQAELASRKPSGTQPDSTRNPNLTEPNLTESNRIESNLAEPNLTGETPEDAAAAEDKNLVYMKGALGKGVVLLSQEQICSLLDTMGIDSFDFYVKKLADFILKNNAHIKNHYQTILKWWEEDSQC